jgi:hypothetical protein
MKLNEKLLRIVVFITILIPLGFGRIATPVALGQTATLRGQITDEDTGIPLPNVTVTLGERITYTDNDGNFEFTDVTPLDSYLFTATASNYEDYGERITISEGDNLKNLSLRSTGIYNGDAGIEYNVTITNPETGYAHINAIFKPDPFPLPSEPIRLVLKWRQTPGISNLLVTNENGDPITFELFHDYTIGTSTLEIDGSNATSLTIEYDYLYRSMDDPEHYHAYICDSYAVFETMYHILFFGDINVGESSAVRFNLPPGWVRVTPWERIGDCFVNPVVGEIQYAAPGVGRFELHRESVGNSEFIIGIHENANDFVPDPVNWPANIQNVLSIVQVADSLLHYEQRKSVVIGIPPLGPNETGEDSTYMPASNFPWGISTVMLKNYSWWETSPEWMSRGLIDYLAEIVYCEAGMWSGETYKANIGYRKGIYYSEVYNTAYDLPIPDLESESDPSYETAKYAKYPLFFYLLDYEIRRVTTKNVIDALHYWMQNLTTPYTGAELLQTLNDFTGNDFTEFFNRYFYGTDRFPELAWDYTMGDPSIANPIYLPIVLKGN